MVACFASTDAGTASITATSVVLAATAPSALCSATILSPGSILSLNSPAIHATINSRPTTAATGINILFTRLVMTRTHVIGRIIKHQHVDHRHHDQGEQGGGDYAKDDGQRQAAEYRVEGNNQVAQ